jgi:hypothetical protein
MIEAKLIVGRFVKITPTPPRDPVGPAVPYAANFVNVVCPPMTMEESSKRSYVPFTDKYKQRTSDMVPGTNPKASKVHRNFKWLPWYKGDISETDLNTDVLTGPMSGCILASYTNGGVRKVGHIGTVDVVPGPYDAAAVNAAVKGLWNGYALAHPGDVVGGFNPVALTVPAHPAAQGNDSWGKTWGLFTTTGDFYAVQVYLQLNTTDEYRIAAVHQVNSMTLVQLQNI